MRAAAAVVPRMVPFGMRAADGPERGQDGGPAQAAMFINYKYKRGDNLQKSTIEKEFHEEKAEVSRDAAATTGQLFLLL